MAKKAKTPRAPRTPAAVQAPKKRVDTRKGGGIGSFPRWIWAVVAAAVVGLAAVAAFAFGGGSSGTSENAVAKAMAAANCTYKQVAPNPPKRTSLCVGASHANPAAARFGGETGGESCVQECPRRTHVSAR